MIKYLELLFGTIVGVWLFSYLQLQFNYQKLRAETVSKSRMQWIDNFREEFATLVGYAKAMEGLSCWTCTGDCCNKDKLIEYKFQAEKARYKLLTRLNMDITRPGNEFNQIMAEALSNIKLECGASVDVNKLLSLARDILEPEWQRVKREAEGKK